MFAFKFFETIWNWKEGEKFWPEAFLSYAQQLLSVDAAFCVWNNRTLFAEKTQLSSDSLSPGSHSSAALQQTYEERMLWKM